MKLKIADKTKVALTSPEATAKILTDILKAEEPNDIVKEHCWGIYLNTRNHIVRIELVSLGILNANLIHPRELLKPAIQSNAAGFILAHNHPSGDAEASSDDIMITKRLKEAAKIMGIEFLDHLIITTSGKFTSLKEEKII